MESYLYTPYELAIIIWYYNMDCLSYVDLLKKIFHYDNIFIQTKYRNDQKKFILSVMDRLNFINNQEQFKREQIIIERDMEEFGLLNNIGDLDDEDCISHLIFKELRIRILFINQKGYAKIKLRTLLRQLGYKKRNSNIINYIFVE